MRIEVSFHSWIDRGTAAPTRSIPIEPPAGMLKGKEKAIFVDAKPVIHPVIAEVTLCVTWRVVDIGDPGFFEDT